MVNSLIGIEDIFGWVFVFCDYSGSTSFARISLDFTIMALSITMINVIMLGVILLSYMLCVTNE